MAMSSAHVVANSLRLKHSDNSNFFMKSNFVPVRIANVIHVNVVAIHVVLNPSDVNPVGVIGKIDFLSP